MKLTYSARTDVGNVRSNNEDNIYANGRLRRDVAKNQECFIGTNDDKVNTFAVFDGVGGESYGEEASLAAAKILIEYDDSSLYKKIDEYISCANNAVLQKKDDLKCNAIATTVALLHFYGDKALICNIGDSRIYRFSGTNIEQISEDHTMAFQMKKYGLLSEEESNNKSNKNALIQFLGIQTDKYILEPYIRKGISVSTGNIFLICSDGVTDMLTDEELLSIIKTNRNEDADFIAKAIIDKSLDAGGKDNTSAIIIKIC